MKKILLGVMVLAVFLLFGCSKDDTSKADSEDEPIKVTIYVPGIAQADQELVTEALKEYAGPRIGAYPEINFIGWGEWSDKKNLMMTSGEAFDIAFTSSWNYYNQEVARNAWLPLDDLIDQHAPSIRATVGDWLDSAKKDGKIYAIPTVKEGADGYAWHYNKKYVDKYNIPIMDIKTPQDLEPWLAFMQEKEPEVIGFLASGHNLPSTYLGNGDKISGENYLNIDGVVTHKWLDDGFWEMVEIQHNWYKKGYLEYNIDDISDKHVDQHMEAGNWFVWPHVSHPGKAGEASSQFGYPIVTGAYMHPQMVTRDIRRGSMLSISRTSRNPEAAIKVLDLMNTDPLFNNMINFGIEGVHYEFVNKEQGIIKPIGTTYRPNMQWALQNQFLNYLQEGEDPQKWAKYKEYNDTAGVYDTLDFFADITPIKTEIATVGGVDSSYVELLYRGLLDPAKYKDQIINDLEVAGVYKVEAEFQKQLDDFLANK